ncbi:general transcription factor IIF subunit 2-like [Saccostrea echinata]|uniref:general transcription factor IIF subunit 2-like n=1 Tax=Saccostrea echinata TaxID=191078 RepID=UPI002A7F1A7E|nr:general transcription factor IIF subunit 2-like [Saccostrea echinata]
MSMPEKIQEPKNVDLSAAGRGVWLVKVPKYLQERWEKNKTGKTEVGKMRITRSKFPGQKPKVTFTIDEEVAKGSPGDMPIPQDHNMILTGLGNQNLVVFSQTPVTVKQESSTGSVDVVASDRIAIEGKVIQRADCQPDRNKSYLNLKRMQLETKNKPQREVIQITKVVTNYKPVKDHVHNASSSDKTKVEKRLRDTKEKVMDILFDAFEKHQYYNVKDLVTITKQPVTYLKEILKEICTYNMKAPHRNMWELKPEYRHYKEQHSSG